MKRRVRTRRLHLALLVVGVLSPTACGKTKRDPGAPRAGGTAATSTGGTTPADASLDAADTGVLPDVPGEGIAFTYGDALHSVLSSPLTNAAGELVVVVGTRREARVNPSAPAPWNSPSQIASARLVALGADGRERWSSEAVCTDAVKLSERAAVAVLDDGYYVLCGELARLDAQGTVTWRLGTYTGRGIAVDGDETAYVGKAQSLAAVGADGVERWATPVGMAGGDGEVGTNWTAHTSAVVVAGRVFVPYDDGATNQGGFAELDPANGRATPRVGTAGAPRTYGSLATDGSEVLLLSRDLLRSGGGAAPGVTTLGTLSTTVLLGATGAAYTVFGSPTGGDHVQLGTTRLPGMPAAPTGTSLEVAALLEPALVLMNTGVALGLDGTEAFRLEAANVRDFSPLALDGSLVYVTDDLRLVARAAPIRGFASGAPWPVPAGNARGTHAL